MIAIWVLGIIFVIIGLFFGLPRFFQMLTYKGKTKGCILCMEDATGSRNQSMRITYMYIIDGITYKNKSKWINNGVFKKGKACDIRYSLNNPQKSYIRTIDQIISCLIGGLFLILGFGMIILGLILLVIL